MPGQESLNSPSVGIDPCLAHQRSAAWVAAHRLSEPPLSVQESLARCRALAQDHYENFTVVNHLLPKARYDDFAAVYAFCRLADDAADERDSGTPAGRQSALAELHWLGAQIDAASRGELSALEGQYFPAIGDVIRRHNLPAELFHRLIGAFERDQRQNRYETWDDLISYCTGSADPVGRLVLLVTEHAQIYDTTTLDEMFRLSDLICTALQLTNFWQDVARDLTDRDRIYIPMEIMRAHGIDERQLHEMVRTRHCSDTFRALERTLVERTRAMFEAGRKLWPYVYPDTITSVMLFTLGGEAILRLIEKRHYDVLSSRPRLNKAAKGWLLVRTLFSTRYARRWPRRPSETQQSSPATRGASASTGAFFPKSASAADLPQPDAAARGPVQAAALQAKAPHPLTIPRAEAAR